MNTQGWRSTRGIRRRSKVLIDLNLAPSDLEGTSASSVVRAASPIACDLESVPSRTMIDVDAIEDDVIESSASAFAQARSKSTGARRRRRFDAEESGGGTARFSVDGISNKRRRVPAPPNQPVIDCEHVPVDDDTLSSSKAPPPEEPKFSCPVCMCPFTEEMSTKCGHIFCKGRIKMAISRQNKCPTCRKKVTAKELIRVFLPTTR